MQALLIRPIQIVMPAIKRLVAILFSSIFLAKSPMIKKRINKNVTIWISMATKDQTSISPIETLWDTTLASGSTKPIAAPKNVMLAAAVPLEINPNSSYGVKRK